MSNEVQVAANTGLLTKDPTRNHPLYPTLKAMKKLSPQAVAILEEGMNSEDFGIRLASAEKLLKFLQETARNVMDDSLQHAALQAKVILGSQQQGNNGQIAPLVDFSKIRSVV